MVDSRLRLRAAHNANGAGQSAAILMAMCGLCTSFLEQPKLA